MKKGTLVQIKKEWLNPGERQIVYVVIEDRTSCVLIQPLPMYCRHSFFLPIETVKESMLDIIDDESCVEE